MYDPSTGARQGGVLSGAAACVQAKRSIMRPSGQSGDLAVVIVPFDTWGVCDVCDTRCPGEREGGRSMRVSLFLVENVRGDSQHDDWVDR